MYCFTVCVNIVVLIMGVFVKPNKHQKHVYQVCVHHGDITNDKMYNMVDYQNQFDLVIYNFNLSVDDSTICFQLLVDNLIDYQISSI